MLFWWSYWEEKRRKSADYEYFVLHVSSKTYTQGERGRLVLNDFLEYPMKMQALLGCITDKYRHVFEHLEERFWQHVVSIQQELQNENAAVLVQERIKIERDIYARMLDDSLDTKTIGRLRMEEEALKADLLHAVEKRYRDETMKMVSIIENATEYLSKTLRKEVICRALSARVSLEGDVKSEVDKETEAMLEKLESQRNSIYNRQLSALRKRVQKDVKESVNQARIKHEEMLIKDFKNRFETKMKKREQDLEQSLKQGMSDFARRKEKDIIVKVEEFASEQTKMIESLVNEKRARLEYLGRVGNDGMGTSINKDMNELENSLRVEKYREISQKIEAEIVEYEREARARNAEEKIKKLEALKKEIACFRERKIQNALKIQEQSRVNIQDRLRQLDVVREVERKENSRDDVSCNIRRDTEKAVKRNIDTSKSWVSPVKRSDVILYGSEKKKKSKMSPLQRFLKFIK